MKAMLFRVGLLGALCALGALAALMSVPHARADSTLDSRLIEVFSGTAGGLAPDGCSQRRASVNFQQATMLAPMAATSPYFTSAFAEVAEFNNCAPEHPVVVEADGLMTFDGLTTSGPGLQSGHILGHGVLTDRLHPGNVLPVVVDVTFDRVGQQNSGSSSPCDVSVASSGKCQIEAHHADGTISGTVTVAGVNFMPGPGSTDVFSDSDLDSTVFRGFGCAPFLPPCA